MRVFYAGRWSDDKGVDKLLELCEGHDLTVTAWGDKPIPDTVNRVPFTCNQQELNRRMMSADVVAGQFKRGSMGVIDRHALLLDKPLLTFLDYDAHCQTFGSCPPHMESLDNPMPVGMRKWVLEACSHKTIREAWYDKQVTHEWAFVGDLCGLQQHTAALLGCSFGWWGALILHDNVVVCGSFPKWARLTGKDYVFNSLGSDLREHEEELELSETIVTSDPILAQLEGVDFIPPVVW